MSEQIEVSVPTTKGSLAQRVTSIRVPSIDDSLGLRLLPALLSLVAGSADVISFLGPQHMFVAHITGNLIILAGYLVTGATAGIAVVLSVPVFVVMLAVTRVLVAGLEAARIPVLGPLLILQFLLLGGFLVVCVALGAHANPGAPIFVLAGMLGVSALAVQNALVRVAVRGAPSTAVMTTNISVFVMDVGDVLLGRDPVLVAAARRRAARTLPAIIGFVAGAALGAALFSAVGLRALALPTGVALICLFASRDG